MSERTERDASCPKCRRNTMKRVGRVTIWGTNPPPVDAAEYWLYRCSYVVTGADGKPDPCGCEIKCKDDGTATTDPRWADRPTWEMHR